MTDPSNQIQLFIAPMLDIPSWGVRQGYGSFVYFEFGQPGLVATKALSRHNRSSKTAHDQGQWTLWVNCCHWRILDEGIQLAWSEDDRPMIDRGLATLNGQSLVAVLPNGGRTVFSFDLGGSMETWPYGDNPTTEQWMLLGQTDCLTYREDGLFSIGPSTTPQDRQEWLHQN